MDHCKLNGSSSKNGETSDKDLLNDVVESKTDDVNENGLKCSMTNICNTKNNEISENGSIQNDDLIKHDESKKNELNSANALLKNTSDAENASVVSANDNSLPVEQKSNAETNENTEKDNEDDFTDAMIVNFQENFNQDDVDSMVRLMESTEDIIFDTGNKQNNVKSTKEPENQKSTIINSEKSEAYNLLAQGKRNLFVKDYESAVATLGEACQKLSVIYGDFAVECGDACMTYGNALLELWRLEEANNAQEENTEETADSAENEKDDDDESNTEDNVKDENDEEDEGNNETENPLENENNEEPEEKADESNAEDNEEDAEDLDDDNLNIAWQVLEVAKKIYTDHRDNLNLAKVYVKLGEISIECKNYNLAVEDLLHSLEIQGQLPTEDSRLKANTHFHLYIAYLALHSYDEAANAIFSAKSILESQLHELEQKLKSLSEDKSSEISKIKNEVNDIEDILRDVNIKITESNSQKREFMGALLEAMKKTSNHENNPSCTSESTRITTNATFSTPVTNISHLIRKKPRVQPEKTDANDKNESKSSKMENSTASNQNGNSDIPSNNKCDKMEIYCSKPDTDSETITNVSLENSEKKRKFSDDGTENEIKKPCIRQND